MQRRCAHLTLWAAAALVTSCVPPQPQNATAAEVCKTVEDAQRAGYRDGLSGQASQASWFMATCPVDIREALATGYQDAHTRGFAEYQATMARNAEAARQAEAEHLTRLCTDPNAAYQAGYNAGYRREMMSADWTHRYCAPSYSGPAAERFIAGFQAGMSQAPQPPAPQPVIVVAPRAGGTVSANVDSCRFSSDCGEGHSCRHVAEIGQSVCMGDGLRGDYCWFNSDCVSDACRMRSGGAKTCN
jgi:hypothetical protein